MILKVVLVLSQRTSLYAHPYDCCRAAANAPALRRTATSSRRTHSEALARARTPTCPIPQWNGERAARSINLKETGVRGVFSAKGPDSSVGGVPVVCCPDEVHMEEEDRSRQSSSPRQKAKLTITRWSKRTLRQMRRM